MAESSQRREKPTLRTRTKHVRRKTVKYGKPVLDEIGKYLPHWARVDATVGDPAGTGGGHRGSMLGPQRSGDSQSSWFCQQINIIL